MALVAIKERELKEISAEVRVARSLLKTRYNAVLTHDSGQTDSAPTWIFTLPEPVCLQVAVRMNKCKLSLYLLDKTFDGAPLEPLLDELADVKKRYTEQGESRSHSLRSQEHAPYLRPSSTCPLLLISPRRGSLEQIFDICLPRSSPSSVTHTPPTGLNIKAAIAARYTMRSISPVELLEQLDRNAAIGRCGEKLVLKDELTRLQALGCPNPEKYVRHVAQTDVSRGYDIASTCPGEERYIEVKTTTTSANDFFLTENERQVLAELGPKGWLYRVVVQPDLSGEIVQRVNDPIGRIQAEAMRAVVWRIPVSILTAES